MPCALYQSDAEDHVEPLYDQREHEHASQCPCVPDPHPWNGKIIWVHRAWDGREITEAARALAFSYVGRN
jgi:hypothetical protein